MTPLERLVRARIAAEGPMRIDAYMALCLGHPEHGYYATRDPFGAAGDFITAPEVSQMFGELIGLWLAAAWAESGRPAPFVLAELGPGRGTLMSDALRAARAVPGFAEAAKLWLVETSPALRARQAERLAAHRPAWTGGFDGLPEGPLLLVANEFFDALPIRQFRRVDPGWQERRVMVEGDRLAFGFGRVEPKPDLDARFPLLPDGVIAETCAPAELLAQAIGRRLGADGVAALIIDYGDRDGAGDTLQSLRTHAPADPLDRPGEADLTAHLRFGALAEAAAPARAFGPLAQGVFLTRLGLAERARRLAAGRTPEVEARVAGELRRLTDPAEMGEVFKVMALTGAGTAIPAGFEA